MKISENVTQIVQKDYVTKDEFYKICGISKKTARKLLIDRKIQFEKCSTGSTYFYKIPLSEVERYKQEKLRGKIINEKQSMKIRLYFKKKLKGYGDVINLLDICVVTGYGKEGVRKWINSGKLLGVISKGSFKIAKEDLLDFLTSSYYQNIVRKSDVHKEDEKVIIAFL